jgi:glycosyltransferase involved in cell wall biosynthesis
MRILIAHSRYTVAGGEDRYVEQQLSLLRSGHTVELLSRRNDTLSPSIGTAARMAVSLKQLRHVEKTMREFEPDVIHVHNPYPALGPAVHLAAERLGVKLVQTVHNFRLRCPNGFMYTEGSPCRRCEGGNYVNAMVHHCFRSRSQASAYAAVLWMHRFALKLEKKVALFIAPSEFMRSRLHDWGIPDNRTQVIRNFVDVLPDVSSDPGSYGTYVGRLSGEKGLGFMLRALSAGGDPPFLIVGDGPIESELALMTTRLGLKNTRLVGRLAPAKVAEVLARARFFVIPSLWEENAPLAVLEAMAAGRPVLVSRRGGLPELVARGGGIVFEPGDIEDLAAKIRILMADDRLCRSLGSEAIGIARKEFSAEGHRAHLEAAYRRALAEAG